jgi:hypothetical protein
VLALAWAQPGRAPWVQTHRAPTQAAAPVAQAVRFIMLNACAETQAMRGTRATRLLYSVRLVSVLANHAGVRLACALTP